MLSPIGAKKPTIDQRGSGSGQGRGVSQSPGRPFSPDRAPWVIGTFGTALTLNDDFRHSPSEAEADLER